MKKKVFITETEREKCQKVVTAFTELYESLDIVVEDAGKYVFVKLYCYEPNYGFYKMTTFTNSKELFHDLWTEWWHEQVFVQAMKTPPLLELDYADILKALPKEKQDEIMHQKNIFLKKAGINANE